MDRDQIINRHHSVFLFRSFEMVLSHEINYCLFFLKMGLFSGLEKY